VFGADCDHERRQKLDQIQSNIAPAVTASQRAAFGMGVSVGFVPNARQNVKVVEAGIGCSAWLPTR
jgi:hypothetical protein